MVIPRSRSARSRWDGEKLRGRVTNKRVHGVRTRARAVPGEGGERARVGPQNVGEWATRIPMLFSEGVGSERRPASALSSAKLLEQRPRAVAHDHARGVGERVGELSIGAERFAVGEWERFARHARRSRC